jgi:hypothetical protein
MQSLKKMLKDHPFGTKAVFQVEREGALRYLLMMVE